MAEERRLHDIIFCWAEDGGLFVDSAWLTSAEADILMAAFVAYAKKTDEIAACDVFVPDDSHAAVGLAGIVDELAEHLTHYDDFPEPEDEYPVKRERPDGAGFKKLVADAIAAATANG